MPLCNRCGREESDDVPFPTWTKTLCKQCDAERKAAWYDSKKSGQYARNCLDCGSSLQSNQHKYCAACKKKRNASLVHIRALKYADRREKYRRQKES